MALALQVVSSHLLGALDIEKLCRFKKALLTFSFRTPQVKPIHSNGRTARAFFCWTAVP